MEKLIATILITMLMVGCTTTKERIVFQPIDVPVPVECQVEFPERPILALENINELNPSDLLHTSIISKSYVISIVQLQAYAKQLEELLSACTDPELNKD